MKKDQSSFNEIALKVIAEGKSFSEAKEIMVEKGFRQYEVNNLFHKFKNKLYTQYEKDVKEFLLSNKTNSNAQVKGLNEEVVSFLLEQSLEKIKDEKRGLINEMMEKKQTEEEILNVVVDDQYTKEDALKEIKNFIYFHKKVDHKERNGYLFQAFLVLIGTICIVFFYPTIYTIGTGIVLFYLSIKMAFSTQAQNEMQVNQGIYKRSIKGIGGFLTEMFGSSD